MIVFHVQHLAGLVIQSAALRLKILSVTACISLNFEPVARFELMMWSCRCLKVFSVFSECVFIPKLSCRCYGSGGIRLFTRSLTPHTHPPKGTILIYNLLFCISRFVLFFSFCRFLYYIYVWFRMAFRFRVFYIIVWVFKHMCLLHVKCFGRCACLSCYVLCIQHTSLLLFFSRVVALNQMKFIISSWISFTLCAHILRPCFFFLSIRNLFHKTTIHTLRLRLLLSETNSLWVSACGRIYFPFSF